MSGRGIFDEPNIMPSNRPWGRVQINWNLHENAGLNIYLDNPSLVIELNGSVGHLLQMSDEQLRQTQEYQRFYPLFYYAHRYVNAHTTEEEAFRAFREGLVRWEQKWNELKGAYTHRPSRY